MAAAALDGLVAALPEGAVLIDPDLVEAYRRDRAEAVRPGQPLAVVRATSVEDVQATLRWATAHHVPVVPRGAGSGLSGGSSAVDGAITLSTERLRWCHVDPAAMVVDVGPGMLNAEVKAAAREHGLWYPPDPSSFEFCSIGGNLATNAGGLCCVKYGVTTDYVLGLDVVLADGTLLRLGGRTIKDVAGLDLKRLFVGSEGTLGVVVGATLRLRPAPPPATTLVATFPDVGRAGAAVVDVVGRLRPAALELMDRTSIRCVEEVAHMGFDGSVGALLLARTDAAGDADVVAAAFERAGATDVGSTDDEEEGEAFMAARRLALPALERLGVNLIEDVGVPIPQIPALVDAIAGVAERTSTTIAVVGHAGDGNLHPVVAYERFDDAAAARAGVAFDGVMQAALDLGGTITGEHGVGTMKRAFLARQLGPEVQDVAARIKAALDPLGLLNPGKAL